MHRSVPTLVLCCASSPSTGSAQFAVGDVVLVFPFLVSLGVVMLFARTHTHVHTHNAHSHTHTKKEKLVFGTLSAVIREKNQKPTKQTASTILRLSLSVPRQDKQPCCLVDMSQSRRPDRPISNIQTNRQTDKQTY